MEAAMTADILVFVPGHCPRHPHIQTSSDDGMFDAPCYACEGEMADAAEAWECDPANPRRRYCGTWRARLVVAARTWDACMCVPDPIPF
jgi:hypothetical protein